MPGDARLPQVARMLGLPPAGLTAGEARAAIAARPRAFGDALFDEAAASDDVTSVDSALTYASHRLTELGDLVPAEAAGAIRSAVRERLRAWEQ